MKKTTKTFYKINTDGTSSIGSGIVTPKGFTEYTKGSEPQELLDALFLMKKPAKIQELYTAYNNANQLDINYMNTTFQADKKSQDLIVSVLSAGSVPTGFFWLDSLNNQVPMTYTQLQGLSGAILARGQANFVKLQSLKAKVKAATTQADLDAIVWS